MKAPRPSRAKRGYDKFWDKLRLSYLKEFPYCCRCGKKATVVDHIQPISEAPELRLERSNLRPMCVKCHNQRTALDQTHGDKTRLREAGVDGMPVAKDHPWYKV